ncbi:MAG: hypothetical protein BWY70_00301 [Bacteroidetes bacterium ADurb.Bin408]|nr:MAG: hypothetical protein BWY70_00301 [Bacteroidetes bacterium ADurb.Bin408]
MQVGCSYKTQGFIAQAEGVAILDDDMREVVSYQVFEVAYGIAAGHHFGSGRHFKQVGHIARMVRLGVVYDNILNARGVACLFEFGQVSIPVLFLAGLHHSFFFSIDKIRVVGRAKFGFHHHVEGYQVGVEDANPLYIGRYV